MTTYQDFWIKLVATERPDVYRVDVVSSPRGGGKSSFQFPFSIDDLGETLTRLGETIRGQARDASKPIRPEEMGKILFDALFVEGTRDRFLESYGSIDEGGLRIKIDVDSDLPLLASLPWEYLYRHETRTFLNLDEKTSVVRYYNPPLEYKPLVVKPPLRILFVTASPSGYGTLALDKEQSAILESLAAVENIEVEFLSHATIETLANRISEPRPFHVWHFMGHGAFDRESGKGAIVLENPDATGDLVDAERLKVLLGKDSNLRLVFLNACDTAKITRQAGLDPFAGVATSLIMQGVPAVVAMQFPISDRAAILFAQQFYKHLAQGDPVDAAVVKGRIGVYTQLDDGQEWGTPALFMRVPEGNIFEIKNKPVQPPSPIRQWLIGLGLLIVAAILFVVQMPAPNQTPTTHPLTSTPEGGTMRTHPIDGAIYVYIPAVTYSIGASPSDIKAIQLVSTESRVTFSETAYPTAQPLYLSDGFWIKRTEVSNAEYQKCMGAGECTAPNNNRWNDPKYLNHPVTHVTWNQANEYAQWVGGRLPDKEEWEIACRGPDATIFPWGNEFPDHTMANVKTDPITTTSEVDSYPDGASTYGVLNMIGNVQEWTNTPHDSSNFYYVQGGSFDSNAAQWNCLSVGWLSRGLDAQDEQDNQREWQTTRLSVVILDLDF